MTSRQVSGRSLGDLPGIFLQTPLRELGRVTDRQARGWKGSGDPEVLSYTPGSGR